MAKRMISVIKPFEIKQFIFVYENGIKIDVEQGNLMTMDGLNVSYEKLIKKYPDIERIQLIGPKTYCHKIVEYYSMTNYASKVPMIIVGEKK